MSRVSQAEARANRERVVEAASRLFRQRGVANVSVVDVMRAVGLTQGGFYKQFASKDALVAEAEAKGFGGMLQHLAELDADSGGHDAAVSALCDTYLSSDHRDALGTGCPAVELRRRRRTGTRVAPRLRGGRPRHGRLDRSRKGGDGGPGHARGRHPPLPGDRGIPLSEEILQAVREATTQATRQ